MLKIGHEIVRPGKNLGDPDINISIPEELATTPGIPLNNREVDWYAKEYPLESMNITERASREWANGARRHQSASKSGHDSPNARGRESGSVTTPFPQEGRTRGGWPWICEEVPTSGC